MERNTQTPIIDGGVVNAPPKTTASRDFVGNLDHSAGTTAPGTHNEWTARNGQNHLGRDTAVGSQGVAVPEQRQPVHHTGAASGISEAPVTGPGQGTGPGTGTRIDARPTSSKIKQSASGVKDLAAAAHGAGETLRGTFNAGIDRAFNDKAGEAHNSAIAAAGEHEINTGQFTDMTKNREGMVAGADGDRRKNRTLLSEHHE